MPDLQLSDSASKSTDQLWYRFGSLDADQATIKAAEEVAEPIAIDAQLVQDRCMNSADVKTIFDRCRP